VSTYITPAFVGQNGKEKKNFETKQGAATTADLSQQELHEEVVALTRLNFISRPSGDWRELSFGP
jgi:hypothetical protein